MYPRKCIGKQCNGTTDNDEHGGVCQSCAEHAYNHHWVYSETGGTLRLRVCPCVNSTCLVTPSNIQLGDKFSETLRNHVLEELQKFEKS